MRRLMSLVLVWAIAFSACVESADAPAKAPPASAAATASKVVRRSALAGSWYEGSRETLEKQVKDLFATAEKPPAGARRVGALVAPHAGYRWAGRSQAATYKVVEGARYGRVILLGPSHHAGFRGISIAPVTHYETPLGEVPLDLEVIEDLKRLPFFEPNVPAAAHAREHSLEIELPFLQVAIGQFKLVPILVGHADSSPRDRSMLASALRKWLDAETLLVASSDFTHYGERFEYDPFPPAERKRRLEELDMGAAKLARAGDVEGFARYVKETGATICGARPIVILLSILPAGFSSDLLSYTTSADLTGEETESVSYVALAFRFEPAKEEAAALSKEELARLVEIARFSLERGVKGGEPPPDAELRARFPLTPKLEEKRGVFVTLKVKEELRGCIGMIFPEAPLYSATASMAVSSALHDSRFPRVKEAELPSIAVEVSALTPPRPVAGPQAVKVGKDGVVLTKGGRSAVFLPQVATEQGWDLETMLTHLSRKAGLPADAWKEGASFLTFQAEIAHEEKKE